MVALIFCHSSLYPVCICSYVPNSHPHVPSFPKVHHHFVCGACLFAQSFLNSFPIWKRRNSHFDAAANLVDICGLHLLSGNGFVLYVARLQNKADVTSGRDIYSRAYSAENHGGLESPTHCILGKKHANRQNSSKLSKHLYSSDNKLKENFANEHRTR